MASLNKVTLIGNLGRDPELRKLPNGASVVTLSIATSRSWVDRASKEKREETEWHRVVFYDRLADIAADYLKKGRSVYIEGRLKTRSWTDDAKVERFVTEIVGEELQMLGSNGSGSNRTASPAPAGAASASPEPASPASLAGDDDVPF